MGGGLWNYDNHMLLLEKVKVRTPLREVQLFRLNMWVCVHNLSIIMMSE